MDKNPQPTLFISHGSPMTALEPREAGAFMQRLGPVLEARFGRPKAILAISAHSLSLPPRRYAPPTQGGASVLGRPGNGSAEPVLLAAPRHEAIYDFGGFDPRLHTLRYDAPGAPELAERVAGLLQNAGLPVHRVEEGGLDHGIWTPLRYMFPDAHIPVLPLAWPPDWAPQRLMALGAALAPLADEGVLIMGSGSITHNLQRVFAGGRMNPDQPPTAESSAFRDWFVARSAARDWPALQAYRSQAPQAVLMHPSDEHLLPWFVAAGAGGTEHAPLRIHDSQTFGDLGMDAYAFGPQASALAQALALVN